MKPALLILAIAISFMLNSLSWAEEESRTQVRANESTTTEDVSASSQSGSNGVAATVLGDPGLTLFGINFLHAFSDVARFRVGVGTLGDYGWATGVGLDYRFQTYSRFRPVVGLDVGYIAFKDHWFELVDDPNGWFNIRTTERRYDVFYAGAKVGAEYQAPTGFLVGLTVMGICGRNTENKGGGCAFDPIPSLRIGTMF